MKVAYKKGQARFARGKSSTIKAQYFRARQLFQQAPRLIAAVAAVQQQPSTRRPGAVLAAAFSRSGATVFIHHPHRLVDRAPPKRKAAPQIRTLAPNVG